MDDLTFCDIHPNVASVLVVVVDIGWFAASTKTEWKWRTYMFSQDRPLLPILTSNREEKSFHVDFILLFSSHHQLFFHFRMLLFDSIVWLLNAWMDSFNLTTFSAHNPYNLIRFFWLDLKINPVSNIRHSEHIYDIKYIYTKDVRLIRFLSQFSLFISRYALSNTSDT